MAPKTKKFTFLPHTADIKFSASGKTLEEAFANSALAVREAMTKDNIKAKIKKGIGIMGDDIENLLYNLLEEIIFLLDAENFIISKVENLIISKDKAGYSLKCDFLGDKSGGYEFDEHIKAITYHDMKVEKKKEGSYEIEVVLDV
ncbi:archease [Candidatus Pacearchaeota archaeon]|nr:archease [Candidatus Pacearchaeota archaeon]